MALNDPALNPVPRYRTKNFWLDWSERVFWTAAQVIIAVLVAETGPLAEGEFPQWSIPITATLLAALKGYVAKQVGNKDSASLAPSV